MSGNSCLDHLADNAVIEISSGLSAEYLYSASKYLIKSGVFEIVPTI